MALDECKLDDNNSDNMLSLHGFTVVCRDRNKQGGGVCVYLHDSLSIIKVSVYPKWQPRVVAASRSHVSYNPQ